MEMVGKGAGVSTRPGRGSPRRRPTWTPPRRRWRRTALRWPARADLKASEKNAPAMEAAILAGLQGNERLVNNPSDLLAEGTRLRVSGSP